MSTPTDPAPSAAEVKERLRESLETVKCYLGNGGLFNPELMEHEKVRNMVMDMRDRITAALSLIERGELERERLDRAEEDIAFLSNRCDRAGGVSFCDDKRDTGISSNSIVSIAYEKTPLKDQRMPGDISDLLACRRAFAKLPAHRKTPDATKALETAEAAIAARAPKEGTP